MNRLFLNGYEVDLAGVDIRLTKQVNDIGDVANRKTNFTNQFKIPKTERNVAFFERLAIPGNTATIQYQLMSVVLFKDGVQLISDGYASIKESNQLAYEITIVDGNIDLIEAIGDLRLNELIWNDINHMLNIDTYTASLTNTNGYIYALAQFGESEITTGYIRLEGQVPSVYKHTIWNKIFQSAGINYTGTFFSDPEFLSRVVTPSRGYNVEEIALTETAAGTGTTDTISKNQSNGNPPQDFEDEFAITGSGLVDLTDNDNRIQSTINGALRIDFESNYNLIYGEFVVGIYLNGTLLASDFLPPETSGTQSGSVLINVSPGDEIYFTLITTQYLYDGVWRLLGDVDIEMTFTFITGGYTVDFAAIMPDTKAIDFIKDEMRRFGLLFRKVPNTNYFEFRTIESILTDFDTVEDWSNKLVRVIKEEYDSGYARNNRMTYKYPEETLVPTHDGNLTISDETIPIEKKLFESIYLLSRTFVEFLGNPLYYVPLRELKEESGDTLIVPIERQMSSFNLLFVDETITIRFFDVITDTVISSPDIPFLSLEDEGYDFFIENYYAAFSEVLNAYKKLTAEIYLTPIDIHNLDFFSLKTFRTLGRRYLLNKVQERGNGIYQAELIELS